MCLNDLFQFCTVSVHTIPSLRVAAPSAPSAPSAHPPPRQTKKRRERERRVRVLVGYEKLSGQCEHSFRWCEYAYSFGAFSVGYVKGSVTQFLAICRATFVTTLFVVWAFCRVAWLVAWCLVQLHRNTQRRFRPTYIASTFQAILSTFRPLEMHSKRR